MPPTSVKGPAPALAVSISRPYDSKLPPLKSTPVRLLNMTPIMVPLVMAFTLAGPSNGALGTSYIIGGLIFSIDRELSPTSFSKSTLAMM